MKRAFYRQNNIPAFHIDRFGRRLPKHTPRVVPDILAIKDGCAILVKSETGKQSAEQKKFEQRALETGARYGVVRSIDFNGFPNRPKNVVRLYSAFLRSSALLKAPASSSRNSSAASSSRPSQPPQAGRGTRRRNALARNFLSARGNIFSCPT